METLVCDTPGLELAYAKFTEVNSDERMRELAWAREKAIRDEHGRLLFAKMEGRAEGRAEGHAEGRAEGREEGRVEGRAEGREEGRTEGQALAAVRILSAFYALEMDPGLEKRLWEIKDPDRLNAVMDAALERRPFSEIAAMI